MRHEDGPRPVGGAEAEVNVQADRHDGTARPRRDLGTVHDALTYTAWGWHVLPCRSGAKLPATAHGFHDATDDPDQLLDWWDAVPTYNLGVATGAVSGLVVLDVDPGGLDTLAALQDEHGPLPRTLSATTPRGGVHGYYRHPGRPVPCSAGKLGPNLDVRGDGGYVLAAPSIVNGTPYRWRVEPWPAPHLADLPPAWVDLLTADPPSPSRIVPAAPALAGVAGRLAAWTTAAVRGELEAVAAAPVGARNATLNRAAFRLGQLTAAGALDGDAARIALEAAATACGLASREAARTIASGFGAGLADPAELPEVAA